MKIVLRQLCELRGSVEQLKTFPNSGRPGRVEGTRELPLARLPFLVVYRAKTDVVELARLLHGAQRWPPINEQDIDD
ncbi:MAG TPA: type II toxin-antitoxin system RelE/ParE family toxin [Candidatus Angelobacter sp.]